MSDWMMLQAQVHQGQSHFATAPTRPDDPEPARPVVASPQQQQQPPAPAVSSVVVG